MQSIAYFWTQLTSLLTNKHKQINSITNQINPLPHPFFIVITSTFPKLKGYRHHKEDKNVTLSSQMYDINHPSTFYNFRHFRSIGI